jgi:hypothetical protein
MDLISLRWVTGYPTNLCPMCSSLGHEHLIHRGQEMMSRGRMADGIREQIARTLREFGFMPKGRAWAYQNPYPDYFDTLPYPHGFMVPDFTRFTEDDATTT